MGKQNENQWKGKVPVVTHSTPRWLIILVTAVMTVVITLSVFGFLLGQNGLAVMESWLLVRWAFVEDDVDLQNVSDGAINGMVSALGDRWSYYVDDESYVALLERRSNAYVGIGVTIDYSDEDGLYIKSVTAGSPAAEAGVQAGEWIVAVEGLQAVGDARYEAAEQISGQPGESRELRLRAVDGSERTVIVLLQTIQVEVATGYLTEDGIGVITLSNFNTNAAQEFQTITEQLLEQGAMALVFDVRGNGGGYVTELTKILDYLLPEGVVFQQKPRWGFLYQKTSDENCVKVPFAVLIDKNSYSAAELFAAQLRESADAFLVGEVTSGKGYSQNTFSLLNGGAAGISTACYYTGNGISLIGTGIQPDVILSLSEEQETLRSLGQLDPEQDPQLMAALQHLRA